MKNKIYFTCLRLSKKGIEINRTEHSIRPLNNNDAGYNFPISIKDFSELYGNLIIEDVKSANGRIVSNLFLHEKHIVA